MSFDCRLFLKTHCTPMGFVNRWLSQNQIPSEINPITHHGQQVLEVEWESGLVTDIFQPASGTEQFVDEWLGLKADLIMVFEFTNVPEQRDQCIELAIQAVSGPGEEALMIACNQLFTFCKLQDTYFITSHDTETSFADDQRSLIPAPSRLVDIYDVYGAQVLGIHPLDYQQPRKRSTGPG